MNVKRVLVRLIRPLSSRKVRIALATVATALAAEFGLVISDQLMLTVVGVSVALILAIAHEDAGRKSRGS